jgi:branched-chain amino acid transport system substrate-binding protein
VNKARTTRRSAISGAPLMTRRQFLQTAGAFGLTATALGVSTACGPLGGGQPDTIQIAVLYPESGEFARLGSTTADATIMAFEEVNANGGIESLNGATIEPIRVDIQSDPTVTRTQTDNVIRENEISVVTGCYASSLSLIASEVTERSQVPFITGSIADELTGRGYEYLFQISPKASMFGSSQVETAQRLGEEFGPVRQSVGIVYEDTDFGTSTSGGLTEAAENAGFDIVINESYPRDIGDADPLITSIQRSGAELLFPVSYLQDAILINEALSQRNAEVTVFGGGAGYLLPDFEQGLGNVANLTFSASSWNWDMNLPNVTEINDQYVESFDEPFLQEHAGEGYAMAQVIVDALERAGSADPTAVRDAMRDTSLEQPNPAAIMPGGRIEFDETGWNRNVFPIMIQWQDSMPRTVYPFDLSIEDAVWPVPPWGER